MAKNTTSPTRAKTGEGAPVPHPPHSEPDDAADGNDATTLIEKPMKPAGGVAGKLRQHSFPDGGGSGGAEAFRRAPRGKPSPGV
jgi:hypothetical protein